MLDVLFTLLSALLTAIVILGALASVLQRRWPYLRKMDDAKQAYIVLTIAAAGMFLWPHVGKDLVFSSIDFLGVKADVKGLEQKVDTLSEQMELFFKSKKTIVYDRKNWASEVRKVRTVADASYILEVTLPEEPIPNSVEIFEGVLRMPTEQYHIEGRIVRFPSNIDNPNMHVAITLSYYPRPVHPATQ